MEEVRLNTVFGELAVPYVVVHMPKPRHARLEPSDSPIFDQLMEEMIRARTS